MYIGIIRPIIINILASLSVCMLLCMYMYVFLYLYLFLSVYPVGKVCLFTIIDFICKSSISFFVINLTPFMLSFFLSFLSPSFSFLFFYMFCFNDIEDKFMALLVVVNHDYFCMI